MFVSLTSNKYLHTPNINDFKWPVLHIILDDRIVKSATNESFGVADVVFNVL